MYIYIYIEIMFVVIVKSIDVRSNRERKTGRKRDFQRKRLAEMCSMFFK